MTFGGRGTGLAPFSRAVCLKEQPPRGRGQYKEGVRRKGIRSRAPALVAGAVALSILPLAVGRRRRSLHHRPIVSPLWRCSVLCPALRFAVRGRYVSPSIHPFNWVEQSNRGRGQQYLHIQHQLLQWRRGHGGPISTPSETEPFVGVTLIEPHQLQAPPCCTDGLNRETADVVLRGPPGG